MKRTRLKPFTFKATLIDKTGKKTTKNFQLSKANKLTSKVPRLERDDRESISSLGTAAVTFPDIPSNEGLTGHEKRQLFLNQKWTDYRQTLLDAYTGECFMPSGQLCVICKHELACLRCESCGPRQYFCLSCGHSLHEHRNQFHSLELWKGKTFVPYAVQGAPLKTHECNTSQVKSVICVDEHGNHHPKMIAFCECEPSVRTLVRHSLWPATPERPSTAFHFRLMHLVETVFLHCKVSLKEFSECIDVLRKPLNQRLVSSIYQLLNTSCFEEYRFFKRRVSTLGAYFPELDNGVTCPLCPKENGVLIECMDACFGLSRKKRQGITSFNLPKHGTLMFADQDDVDNHVNNYCEKAHDVPKDCSRFHAGEVTVSLRSKGKNKLFDDKGVFGRVCRHDFPKGFHNIKHGERIAYPIYELKRFVEENKEKKGLKMVMMYDIACILDKHIEKNIGKTSLVREVKLAIPIFHCYGHKASCQIKYSPRRVEGVGLTDGEGTERLWSFLRDYARITKEMAPDKRVDVLTDGLLHYAERLRHRFGPVLKMKLKRTQKLLIQTSSDLDELCKSMAVTCTDELIDGWLCEELLSFQPKEKELTWDEEYVRNIRDITKMRHIIDLSNATSSKEDTSLVQKNLERLVKSTKAIETRHGITKSWDMKSTAAQGALHSLVAKSRDNILFQLHRLASERVFLLEMKKKYADGQSIAVKLSREISKVVISMNSLLEQLNNKDNRTSMDKEMIFDDIKDPKSVIYACVDCGETSCTTTVPTSTKSKLIHFHCIKKRCKEELNLLNDELNRFVAFLESELHKIDVRASSEGLGHGLQSMLLNKRVTLIQELAGLQHLWSNQFSFSSNYIDILHNTLNDSQEEVLTLLEEDVTSLDRCDDVDDDLEADSD